MGQPARFPCRLVVGEEKDLLYPIPESLAVFIVVAANMF